MEQQTQHNLIEHSLPLDIVLSIASSLQVEDVCALGGCSQFWRELCKSDHIWESLTTTRWPSLLSDPSPNPTHMIWRDLYMARHEDIAIKADAAVQFVKRRCSSGSLEFADLKVLTENLCSWQFSFKDVQMLLFKPTNNVLLNLVALLYCILDLQVPPEDVMDALVSCKIADKRVNVKWWKLGQRFFGFRLRDEFHSRSVSLADLTTANGADVLLVLRRGVIHEVLRVEIFSLGSKCSSVKLIS
ncbi:hypothetical protein Tsubulata_009600 [Turnera subulata]|uniref:F-box domain-containing protein n=1 Tax=Turnera subulata TaxID=218843 RepID=A0A9Q0F2Q0_9ROSI|nr:hypothetical protein Tsubulata_009600 [Turnera subulata]